MASNSKRRSGSSGDGRKRKRVVITQERVRDGGSRAQGNAHKKHRPEHEVEDRGKKSKPSTRRRDPKRAAREQRLVRQRRTALIRALGGVLLLGAVAFGAVTIYRSDALPVNRVLVDGIVNLSEDEVHAAAGVPEDATLLRLPVNEIEDRLLENPWIERVEISRSFPDAVRITITERTPVAYVDTGEAVLWLVDASGFVISSGVPDPEDARVVIRDLDGVEPVAGETLADPVAVNVLTILSGLSSELRGMVRAISAPSVDRTALITVDDVEVLVGSADDLDLKDTVARRILLEQQGAAVYIDVRTPERPTWRGLETPR